MYVRRVRHDRCCLCDSPDVCHMERRPTGRDRAPQEWPFCSECWQNYLEESDSNDPHVIAAFVRFVRIIVDCGATGKPK
jgi:hypothetical protein